MEKERRRGEKYVNRSVPRVLLMFKTLPFIMIMGVGRREKVFHRTLTAQLTVYLTINASFSNAQWWSN